jgi:D-tagatose-1,6-bisphosphate aldolase subunit GatZ/KbaZ
MTSTGYLLDVSRNRGSEPVLGVYSVCSANRFVLEAAMHEAKADGSVLLIESTSNQVNQFGGYTGIRPAAFVSFVADVAAEVGFPGERTILGGDHLGPNCWQREPAAEAMEKARELIRQYVLAGYTKIHLDTSMRLADDPGSPSEPLRDVVITERAADLAVVAEQALAELPPGRTAPLYVIGTDVPPPGGEKGAEDAIWVTRPQDAERTIELTRAAFAARGLERAFERVIAVVVQPGVEFGDTNVFEYDRARAAPLKALIEAHEGLVYECHSTDYQTPDGLVELVEDHFGILKVGPWLTFAFREALFALAEVEAEWLAGRAGVTLSGVRDVMEDLMLRNPADWERYYKGDAREVRFARRFSYSDRIRYYWPQPEAEAALARLLANLEQWPAPLSLISQHLPVQYNAVRQGLLSPAPRALIRHKVLEVLDLYARACRMKG